MTARPGRFARKLWLLAPAGALIGFSLVAPGHAAAANTSVIWDSQASTDPYGTSIPPGNQAGDIQPNTEVEPSIAVNPGDPNDVVTVFQEGRHDGGGDADNGFAATLDAENSTPSWTFGSLPGVTKAAPGTPQTVLCAASGTSSPFDRASDAVVTFGKDPTGNALGGYIAYANSLVFDDTTCSGLPSGMAMNQSSDGGKTWTNAVILEADNFDGLNDKNWIVADNGTGTGHHTGRVYNFWDKVVAGLAYSYCDPDVASSVITGAGCDKAANWSSFTPVTGVGPAGGNATTIPAIGVIPVVLTNGSVGLVFDDEEGTQTCTGTNPTDNSCLSPSGSDIAWTVIPGAGSIVWPSPLPVADDWVDVTPYDSTGISDQRAGSLPQVAVDPNTDEVYIVWESNRFRDSLHQNQNDAVIVHATDNGAGAPGISTSFSMPVAVDPEGKASYIDDYNPTIAIGQDSIVRVAYRQRDENAADGFDITTGRGTPINTYYQESRDQGATFTSPLLVDTVQDTPDAGYGAYDTTNVAFGLFEGDYEQIAAGGNDESYVTRDEAYMGSATSAPRNFTSTETPSNSQWQQTWVAHLGPEVGAATPDVKFVPALVVVGGAVGVGALLLRRRRNRRVAPE